MIGLDFVVVRDLETNALKRLETDKGKPFAWFYQDALVIKLKGGQLIEVEVGNDLAS